MYLAGKLAIACLQFCAIRFAFIDRSCVTALSQGMIVPHTLDLIL
jgi:hypothetical protein